MKISTSEPMTHFSHVQSTKNYGLFKTIDGNRNINLLHLNRLRNSIILRYLFTIIVVNEHKEIIDGQHRFEVIRELGLPLFFIECKGYGLREVHILNQISKTWTSDDYLEGYCNMGYPEYLKYREFKETYGFGHHECMSMLSGSVVKNSVDVFYGGNFKVRDLDSACRKAEKILLLAPYYEGYKRKIFVFTMISLLENPEFEYTELLQKLKQQPTALVDCVTTKAYLTLIEEIYNYRRREKVNLRYIN